MPGKLAGSKFTVFDEDTGESTEYAFTDSPLSRLIGSIHSTCETFRLSPDEAAAVSHFFLFYEENCGGIPSRVPPYITAGIRSLIRRGWMFKKSRIIYAVDRAEIRSIYKAASASLRFGESSGRA